MGEPCSVFSSHTFVSIHYKVCSELSTERWHFFLCSGCHGAYLLTGACIMAEVESKYETSTYNRQAIPAKFHAIPLVRYLKHAVNDDVYCNQASFDCLGQPVFIRIY